MVNKPEQSVYSILFLAIATVLIMKSCTPESCYEDTLSAVKAGFYETGTGNNILPDSVTIYGVGMESSPVYENAKKLMEAIVFLDPSAVSCSYVFIINDSYDTVTFHYTSFPHLISKECGYSMFHTLESYSSTGNLLDTIIITNNNITIPNEENIRIFF